MTKKTNKNDNDQKAILDEVTNDLKRTRADFENYRKRVEIDIARANENGQASMAKKLLPVVDDIERSINHLPTELETNNWAAGIVKLSQNLEKALANMGITRIDATPGQPFNPDLHHAVQFDDTSIGEHEVVAEELQPGYLYGGQVLREAMVRVRRG
jgi:molecular chaperone GrpE